MDHTRAAYALLIFALSSAVAQDRPQLVVEVEPQARVTEHVLFVVDSSGSMHGFPIDRAIGAVRSILNDSGVDELQVGVISFSDTTSRWPGRPERRVPQGWAAFPSDLALEELTDWLESRGAVGDTCVVPALLEALREPREDLTIVLVSDGIFGHESGESIQAALIEAQARREAAGHGRAVIAVYGIGPRRSSLVTVAEVGLGGYFRDGAPSGAGAQGPY